MGNLLIYLIKEEKRQKTGFYLNVNKFLNCFFLIIQFLTLLFYLSFYGGLKTFIKELNYVKFFQNFEIIKFKGDRLELF